MAAFSVLFISLCATVQKNVVSGDKFPLTQPLENGQQDYSIRYPTQPNLANDRQWFHSNGYSQQLAPANHRQWYNLNGYSQQLVPTNDRKLYNSNQYSTQPTPTSDRQWYKSDGYSTQPTPVNDRQRYDLDGYSTQPTSANDRQLYNSTGNSSQPLPANERQQYTSNVDSHQLLPASGQQHDKIDVNSKPVDPTSPQSSGPVYYPKGNLSQPSLENGQLYNSIGHSTQPPPADDHQLHNSTGNSSQLLPANGPQSDKIGVNSKPTCPSPPQSWPVYYPYNYVQYLNNRYMYCPYGYLYYPNGNVYCSMEDPYSQQVPVDPHQGQRFGSKYSKTDNGSNKYDVYGQGHRANVDFHTNQRHAKGEADTYSFSTIQQNERLDIVADGKNEALRNRISNGEHFATHGKSGVQPALDWSTGVVVGNNMGMINVHI